MSQSITLLYIKFREKYCRSGISILSAYMFLLLLVYPLIGRSQNEPQYDEVSVFLNIQGVGGVDIPGIILDEIVYLPVADIFSFLKLKVNPSNQLDSVTGFFINPQATYCINRHTNNITFQGKVYNINSGDIIKTETNLYLNSAWFGKIFGLDCDFNFRSLSIMLKTKLELPIVREMRLEQMRSNISRLKGDIKTDTTIERNYPVFHLGMADWSVISTQEFGGKSDTRLNFSLGSVIAGGEANALINFDSNTPFNEKQQQYQWRFVNNNRPALRQVTAGKIYTQVTSSIYDPIVGVQFSNTPTTYRRSFGTYTLSDITEPNWIVELYVNNVLVDYMKADASGFFKFEVPLVYGNTAVKLRFYGPWGEERTKEQNISIPFNFLPPKELEYSVSAGMVEDTLSSRFSRAALNYGISRRLTIGSGVEYLSSVITGTTMPFVSTSLRLSNSLLITGEYSYGVRARGFLSYRLPSNLQLELNYSKYVKGQKAIIFNYLEERKATLSIPIKGRNFAAYSRLTVNQIVLPGLKNTNAEMLWSGALYGVSTNFTTYSLFTDLNKPYIYSNLSLAFRLPGRFTLTPQAQYDYNKGGFISARTNLEKPLFKKGFLNLSYEKNFRGNTQNIEVGFRYDLSFAQTGFSVRTVDDQITLVESARGSLLYDKKSHYLGTSNKTNVGKGGISIIPFLDINGNSRRDKGEPKVAGLQFRINGGSIIRNDKDTTIRVLDLTPYTSYILELDKNSFDNIAWQMHNLVLKVNIDANQFKTIEVPVGVMGEASGTVYQDTRGKGRILVCFYQNDSTLVSRTLTESDGYFSYLGLKPGNYTAKIDPEQLRKLKMVSSPEQIPVQVSPSKDGDIIENLNFILSLIDKELVTDTAKTIEQVKPVTAEPTVKTVSVAEKTEKATAVKETPRPVKPIPSAISKETKGYQIGAFKNKSVALATFKKLGEVTTKPATMVSEGGYYKIRVEGLSGKGEADSLIYKIEHGVRLKTVAPKAAKLPVAKEIIAEKTVIVSDNRYNFVIQVGAFAKEKNANRIKEELNKTTTHPIYILFEDGYYKLQIDGFKGWKQASEFLPKIIGQGYSEAYIKRAKKP